MIVALPGLFSYFFLKFGQYILWADRGDFLTYSDNIYMIRYRPFNVFV